MLACFNGHLKQTLHQASKLHFSKQELIMSGQDLINQTSAKVVDVYGKSTKDTLAYTEASKKAQDAKEYATGLKNTFDDIMSQFF